MRQLVKYRKGTKQLKKIAQNPERTLARLPIYNRAYPKKLSSASPGNTVGVTKPCFLFLFVQQDKKSLEKSRNLEETYCMEIFGNKSMRKVRSESKFAPKLNVARIAQIVPQFKRYASV